MTEIAVGEQIAETAWTVLKPFLGFIVAAAIGFGAAEAWEHHTHPTIFGFAPFGQSLSTQLADEKASEPAKLQLATQAGIAQQTKSDAVAFANWKAALDTANATATSARDAAAQAAQQAQAATSKQASAAYQLGRATCGAPPNATLSGSSVPSGGNLPSGGVRDAGADDFATLFAAGAYAPAAQAAVPGGSG